MSSAESDRGVQAAIADMFAAMCDYPEGEPHACHTLIAAHDAARLARELRVTRVTPPADPVSLSKGHSDTGSDETQPS